MGKARILFRLAVAIRRCSQEIELSPVFFRIGVDSPLLNQIIDDGSGPENGIVWLLLRPICIAKNGDVVLTGLHAVEGVPVLWIHLEKLFPGPNHFLFGSGTVAFAIDEGMVVGHEKSESVQVLIVDAFVESECDEFWVLRVHC